MLAAPKALAICGVIILAILAARVVLLYGLAISSPSLIALLGVTLAFIAVLGWAAGISWAPGPVRLDLTSEGMQFAFRSGNIQSLRWGDPYLDVSVIDFSNTPWDKDGGPQPVPMYLTGIGVWRSFGLTSEAGSSILREAREHSLLLTIGGPRHSLFRVNLGQSETHIRGRASAGGVLQTTRVPD